MKDILPNPYGKMIGDLYCNIPDKEFETRYQYRSDKGQLLK